MPVTGLDELRNALRRLPADLADDADEIVYGAATDAKNAVAAGYPSRTGNLKKGLKVTREKSTFSAGAVLKNTAPHANIFEAGTQARHTDLGAFRGSMPPGRVFVPA